MADIDAIKQLREETGAGVMAARKALDEAGGDMEKAKQVIHKAGLAKAEKKSDRDVKAGSIYSYIHGNEKVGVMLELNCETDFVAKTDEFQNLANEIALQVAGMSPENVEELLEQDYIRDTSKTIDDLIKSVVGKLGENISLRRFARFELGEELA